ncbi:MAG TPA: hypothetical protein ENG34_00925 [Candidatus Aenigmarchaeota archaeon]|nr:hypothetical protein [Candidatus Aenigmarchaeota archaeon]
MKKGISPLMASIILIALTLAVAGILGSWFTSLTKTQTEQVEESTVEQVNCTSALLDIVDVSCVNITPSVWQLKIVIANLGLINLYDFSVSAKVDGDFFYNSTGGPNSTNPLTPGQQTVLVYNCTVCDENDKISSITVTPAVCPAQAKVEKSVSVTCTAS